MAATDIETFLSSLGLSQYAPSFKSNAIGVAELSGLTGDDLKELGVSILGDRKAILGAIQARGAPAAAASTQAQPQEEQVYLETSIAIVNGGVAPIKVTSRRAILGDKTYVLQNIAAVEAYSTHAEVDKQNAQLEATWNATIMQHRLRSGGFGAFSLLCTFGAIKDSSGSMGLTCGIATIIAFIIAARTPPKPELTVPIWSVRIQASGTSSDVVQSLSREKIEEVVKALNEAIVNLNM